MINQSPAPFIYGHSVAKCSEGGLLVLFGFDWTQFLCLEFSKNINNDPGIIREISVIN